MKVAIVILNYNGRSYLEQFLPTVVKYSTVKVSDNQGFTTEVVVADNASTDDSLLYLKENFPVINCIELDKNYGFAEGYNKALEKVSADLFVLLNSDVEVTENWLFPVIDLMKSDQLIAACQPKILAYHEKDTFEHAGASGGYLDGLGYPYCRGRIFDAVEKDEGQYNDVTEVFWATGAALFIKASLYEKMNGFDGDFFAHMEEIDLCWRLRRAGFKIMVCPASKVYHVGGGTLNVSNPFKTYLNFRNNLVLLMKNESSRKLLWSLPLRFVLDGFAGGLFLLQGKVKDIGAILKAHGYFYLHFFSILKKRMKIHQVIDELFIGKPRQTGRSRRFLVWQYYAKKRHKFSEIKH